MTSSGYICNIINLRILILFFQISNLWISFFDFPNFRILIFEYFSKNFNFPKKNLDLFFMFSYIRGGPFSPPLFEIRGTALLLQSLIIFQLHNFPNFIFQKPNFSHPTYIHYLIFILWLGFAIPGPGIPDDFRGNLNPGN